MNKSILFLIITILLCTCKQKDVVPNCLFYGNCRVKSLKDHQMQKVEFIYDANKKLKKIIYPKDYFRINRDSILIEYNACEIISTYKGENKIIKLFEYNNKRELIKIIDKGSNSYILVVYDNKGFPIKSSWYYPSPTIFGNKPGEIPPIKLNREITFENDEVNISKSMHFEILSDGTKKLEYTQNYFYDDFENNLKLLELINFSFQSSIPLYFSKNNLTGYEIIDSKNSSYVLNRNLKYDLNNRVIEKASFFNEINWECN